MIKIELTFTDQGESTQVKAEMTKINPVTSNELIHSEATLASITSNRVKRIIRIFSVFNDMVWTILRACGLTKNVTGLVIKSEQTKQLEPFKEFLDGKEEED